MKKLFIGAAYYPELWDESDVDADIARCKSLGINVLRLGEFAWGSLEPREGEFDLDRLASVVDKLYENGIYTVMCTPTCTPPRWLLDKYEETRAVTHDGKRRDVSSRCHTCKTSKLIRRKNAVIVTELAKRLGGHKGVIGWQIDNEIYPYGDGCYCPLCQAAFREYLKDRFVTIERLNDAWGMDRWSLRYDGFDAVRPPYPEQWRHPSLRKAWWDFQCRQIKTYVDEQAEILHAFGCKNVGTDMMSNNYLSYYDVNEKTDVVQFNHYDPAQELPSTAFSYDFLRCVKDKPFWVTETQVGWNGSEFADNGYRPAGNCYANTILPFARGAEMNMYWLFRAHRSGHELAHGALFSTAGREYRVSDEVRRACSDLSACEDFLNNTRVKSKIALHYSSTATNTFSCAPMLEGFDYRATLAQRYHAAFRHYNIDVIDTAHSLDGYEIVISPFLATLEENGLRERVVSFIEKGGTWIVGPMSDVMNRDVNKYTHSPYGFLEELAGVYTRYQKPIDSDAFKAVWRDGAECKISSCFDAYEIDETDIDVTSLARYDGGEFDGLSVVVQRKLGKGRVILVGSVIEKFDLLRLANSAPIADASDNVILTERTGKSVGGMIACEVENKRGSVVLCGEYTDVISGRKLSGKTDISPYEALVLVKNK